MASGFRPITADDVKRGMLVGKVRLTTDAYGNTVCNIGDRDCWFYFGGLDAEEMGPWQYVVEHDFEEIVRDIVDVLEDFMADGSFRDEWTYYRLVLDND